MGKQSRLRRARRNLARENGRHRPPPQLPTPRARQGRSVDNSHEWLREISDHAGEWAGIPYPLDGFRLVVEPRHPLAGFFKDHAEQHADDAYTLDDGDIYMNGRLPDDPTKVRIRNYWYSRSRSAGIYLIDTGPDTPVLLAIRPKHRATDRLTFWLSTAGASQAWDITAEETAQDKLASLIKPHLMDMYRLTGSFMETSTRSRVTYLLRRSRPTIALVPSIRGRDDVGMKALAVLCMHPIGFYDGTWAGAMVPTDDVIAHLLMIRGDEHGFWRRANQHPTESPQAGI